MEARFLRCEPADFGIPVIALHELYFGAFKGPFTQANLARIAALEFEVVGFGADEAREAGRIRAHLASAGTQIGAFDNLIAAQALARELILITHDTREFVRVPGLKIEDWEA